LCLLSFITACVCACRNGQNQTSKDRITFKKHAKLYQHKQQVIHQLAFDGDPNLRDCGLITLALSGMGLPEFFVSSTLARHPEVLTMVNALMELMVTKLRPGTSIDAVRQVLSGELTEEGIPTPAHLGGLTGRNGAAQAAAMVYKFMARPGDGPCK
jgi:hypothetical protein